MAERSPIPTSVLEMPPGRFSPSVEVTAYFVASESLANVAKHSRASSAWVRAVRDDGHLTIEV